MAPFTSTGTEGGQTEAKDLDASSYCCVECGEQVCDTIVPFECRVSHCERTLVLHSECARRREPLLCPHHQQRYQRNRSIRWLVGLGCGGMLLGGTVAIGYGSAILTNHILGYFTYAPFVLLPHRMQVLVHGLSWLLLGGGALTAWQYLYPERQRIRPRSQTEVTVESTSSSSSSSPAAPATSTVIHHHHHQSPDANWPMLYWLTSANRPSVVVNNNNGSDQRRSHTDDHDDRKDNPKTDSNVPPGIVEYESPGWGAMLALGAGAAFGIYKIWNTMYSSGCRYWDADLDVL